MPFDIPEPFTWDESFSTFFERIDDGHKILFNGIFNVANKRDSDFFVRNLYDVFQKYFGHEEELMVKSNFPDYMKHREKHEAFLARLRIMETPVSDTDVEFTKDWLVQHIKGSDFKYKDEL